MKRMLQPTLPLSLIGLLLWAPSAKAEVRLPSVLGSNMVLQRDVPLAVWGWADPGEEVFVTLAGNKAGTRANADGEWKVQLPPLAASAEPLEMTVVGRNTLRLGGLAEAARRTVRGGMRLLLRLPHDLRVPPGSGLGHGHPPREHGRGETENWSTTLETNVSNEIVEGLNNLSSYYSGPTALRPSWTYHYILGRTDTRAQVTVEPISGNPHGYKPPVGQHHLQQLGYGADPSMWDKGRHLNGDQRAGDGTNWAFTVFAANSVNNLAGTFSDSWPTNCVVASALDVEDYSGRKAFTKTQGKNDRSVLLLSKPET